MRNGSRSGGSLPECAQAGGDLARAGDAVGAPEGGNCVDEMGEASGPPGVERPAGLLDDEGGFATVAMALALLVCLTLVFATATAGWVISRSSEVQRVADASAMAGENVVAAYATVAQVVDACTLSLGLTGLVTYGAGLVLSCIPLTVQTGAAMCEAGSSILEARTSFAQSAASGLQAFEAALPLLIVANSASTVAANSTGGISYVGCAIPFPTSSESDFSALEDVVDDSALEEASEELTEASEKAAEAQEEAEEALEKGWEADCGSSPYSLWERASTLAGLPSSSNPCYSSSTGWNFGVALSRARSYYAARLESATVGGDTGEEITDSACRRAFYEYALAQVNAGHYVESADGTVSIDLPSLPRNAAETRETTLYTDSVWPCTEEAAGRTLHSSTLCPGATGDASGTASLKDLEDGVVVECDECGMSVTELGRVASASTSIQNGFEYHWRIIVEASEEYEQARNELAEAESSTQAIAEGAAETFEWALSQLSSVQVTLCPPGAWGCVAAVYRADGTTVPTELTEAFLSATELPAGAAVSAATLAADDDTTENGVLASFFDGLSAEDSVVGGALDGVLELWETLLVGYGSAYESVGSVAGDFLDDLDGVLGGTAGSWLKGKLQDVLEDAGLDPVDMRLRKPVLASTQDVLAQAGVDQAAEVQALVEALPDSTDASDIASAVGLWLVDQVGDGTLTIAELTVPGTSLTIPLTVDLSSLVGAA